MPWCTKCKMEYVEGIAICPDCGQTLAENLKSTALYPLFVGDNEICQRLLEFLHYSNLTSMVLEETEQEVSILISEEELEEARKLAGIFFQEEKTLSANKNNSPKKEISEKEAVIEESIEAAGVSSKTTPSHYIKKEDKYQDLKSSVITLLFVGTLGIIFVFLNALGILPIRFASSNFLFYIVMSSIFLIFIIGGILTLRSSKKIKNEVQEEEIFIKQITDWFLSSYTSEIIDAYSLLEEGLSEEIKYFKRTDYMKKELSDSFPNLDEAFLEEIIDIFYQKLYDID